MRDNISGLNCMVILMLVVIFNGIYYTNATTPSFNPHIYVIKSPNRSITIDTLNKLDYYDYTIINALTPDTDYRELMEYSSYYAAQSYFKTSNALNRFALQMSYVNALDAFINSNSNDSDYALIMEDDVIINNNITKDEILNILSLSIKLDFDIMYLGWCYECDQNTAMEYLYGDKKIWYKQALYPLCRHAILWNKSFAKWYLQHWKPLRPPFRGGDQQLAHLMCAYNKNKLRLTEPIFYQYSNTNFKDSRLGNTDKKETFYPHHWGCQRWQNMCKNARRNK